MVKSEQQRQRKLAKKRSKDIQKRKVIARKQQELGSLAGKMQLASRGRIIYSGISTAIRETGIGHVVIAREAPSGEFAVAVFLVDAYCLGVKDTFGVLRVPSDARELLKNLEMHGLTPASPGLARGLVEGAIEYARSLGLAPHSDYRKLAPIWGDLPVESIAGKFEFGREGQPCYISGPHDDEAKQNLILRTLETKVGANNFKFTIGGPGMAGLVLPEHWTEFTEETDDGVESEDWFEGSIDGEVIQRIDNPERE